MLRRALPHQHDGGRHKGPKTLLAGLRSRGGVAAVAVGEF